MEELKTFPKRRKYPLRLVENGIKKALTQSPNNLRNYRPKLYETVIPFVSTYNPNNPEMIRIIKENQHILERSDTMKEIMNSKKFLKSKRQMPNLKRMLCKARFSKQQSFIVTKCKRGNCGLCKHLIEDGQFKFINGITFTVDINMSCDVKNVVYVIRCQGCDEDNVGETGNLS